MAYGESKVYFDGSHYIAIPHTERPYLRRQRPPEEMITVEEQTEKDEQKGNISNVSEDGQISPLSAEKPGEGECVPASASSLEEPEIPSKASIQMTRKELFNSLYAKYIYLRRSERTEKLTEEMRPYFPNESFAKEFVRAQLYRKERNLICRRIRMTRKANLQDWNYFCTFTYDDKKMDEQGFKAELKKTFKSFAYRRDWRYMGCFERSPKKRLHFHGLFYVPEGAMPGMFAPKSHYSFTEHKRKTINQSIYFLERFGVNDFEPIDDKVRIGNALGYIMKYIEKSGEPILYSKGLAQYFISDILEDDIVCTVGTEEAKFVLFDDFACISEGEYLGPVSHDIIKQMRKAN